MTGCCDRGLRIWKRGFVREGSEDDDVYEAYAARVEAEGGAGEHERAAHDPSAGLRYDVEGGGHEPMRRRGPWGPRGGGR